MRTALGIIITLASLGLSATASATGYENIAIGDRTAAMGGTGLAKGSDSAMPALNPAGVALVANSTLSLSASAYQLEFLAIPDFSRPFTTNRYGLLTPDETELTSTSFLTLASAFSGFLHLAEPGEEGWVLAGSLTVPYARQDELRRDINFSAEPGGPANFQWRKEASNTINETQYAVNLTAANSFGPLRLGVSMQFFITNLLLSYEREELIENGLSFERQIVLFERSATSFDSALMLGAQLDLTSRLSVGASIRSPSLHLFGSYNELEEKLGVNNDDLTTSPSSEQTNVEGDFINGVPIRLGAGFEYSNDEWGFAADVTALFPAGDMRRFEGDGTQITRVARSEAREQVIAGREEVHERRSIVNLNVGGFVSIGPDRWMRFGAYTDHSAVDIDFAREDGMGLFEQSLDYYGLTTGYTTQLGPVETTLGLRGAVGFGQTSREVLDPNLSVIFEPTDAQAYNIGFFVSGAIDTTLEDTYTKKREEGATDPKLQSDDLEEDGAQKDGAQKKDPSSPKEVSTPKLTPKPAPKLAPKPETPGDDDDR